MEQNSSTSDSRVMYPIYILGRSGEVMLLAVWITSTAPMNTDISAMSGMELMTSFSASMKNCLMDSRHFSGRLNTSLRNIRYRPVSYRKCLIMSSKVRIKSVKWQLKF